MDLLIAGAGDIDSVAELVNQAYRAVAAQNWTSEVGLVEGPRTSRRLLGEMMEKDASTILLAKDPASGRLSGCVALTPMAGEEWYLSMLAVSPQWQSAGLGSSLVMGAEKFARDAGARILKISVINLRGKLIEWYERRGFARTGQEAPFTTLGPDTGVPLREDLLLITLAKSLQA